MNDNVKNMEPETLITRYLMGSATASEHKQLLEWLQASEENKKYFMQLKQISDRFAQMNSAEVYDVDVAIAHFDSNRTVEMKPKKNNVRRIVLWSAACAAAVALLVSVAVLRPHESEYTLTAQTDAAVKEVLLPDQSTVTLNKKTKVFCAENFSSNRRVRLSGEAYFAVEHDAEHPFVVEYDDLQIKVLGTEFNVYPDIIKSEVVVTVASGRVMVTYGNRSEIINKGERVTYSMLSHSLVKTVNSDENYNSWKTGKLFFDDTPLKAVLAKLNAQYGVEYVIGDTKLDSCKLNAAFDFKDVDRVTEFLSIMLKVEIKKENNKLVLYERAN